MRLQWSDPTKNDLPGASRFTDGCAIQVPSRVEPTEVGLLPFACALTSSACSGAPTRPGRITSRLLLSVAVGMLERSSAKGRTSPPKGIDGEPDEPAPRASGAAAVASDAAFTVTLPRPHLSISGTAAGSRNQ